MDESRPLLILGMHRSGTSLLASIFSDAGWFAGDELVGALEGNPRGHFEDKEILDFHEQVLRRERGNHLLAFDNGSMREKPLEKQPLPEDFERARDLVAKHRREGYWGWKEPRTCLLLDFWREVLPDMQGVIIYRHPMEVYFSFLRRAINYDILYRPEHIIRAFGVYVRPLVKALREAPERFTALSAEAAFSDADTLGQVVDQRVGLGGVGEAARKRFHASELRNLPLTSEMHEVFSLIFPQEAALYEELQDLSVLPRDLETPAEDGDASLQRLKEVLEPMPLAHRIDLFAPFERSIADAAGWDLDEMRAKVARKLSDKVDDYQKVAKGYEEQADELEEVWGQVEKVGADYEQKNEEYQKLWDEHERLGQGWIELVEKFKKAVADKKRLWQQNQALREELEGLKKQKGLEKAQQQPAEGEK